MSVLKVRTDLLHLSLNVPASDSCARQAEYHLSAGCSSPSHAETPARMCDSLQCGQPSSVLSRGRLAKLAASKSIPVSTTLPVAGHKKFSVAITTPLWPSIGYRKRRRFQPDVMGRLRNRSVRFGASGRSAAIISTGLILALSLGNPVRLGSHLCSLRSRTATGRLTVPIPNFSSIGTRPKLQFLTPSPTSARCSYFGHGQILAARCDEKIAQSTEQNRAGRCDAWATVPRQET
jgi:hypothetical protein